MTTKDTGGPAFPTKRRVQRDGYLTGEYEPCGGMTLRDYFAAKVLQGIWSESAMLAVISRGPRGRAAEVAQTAYEMADAMLAERNKQ